MKLAARLIFSLGLALAAWGAGEVYVAGCAVGAGEAPAVNYAKSSSLTRPLRERLDGALLLLAAGAALAGAGHKAERP